MRLKLERCVLCTRLHFARLLVEEQWRMLILVSLVLRAWLVAAWLERQILAVQGSLW